MSPERDHGCFCGASPGRPRARRRGSTSCGETVRARDRLEKALATGYGFEDRVEHGSDLDPRRGRPRSRELVERMG